MDSSLEQSKNPVLNAVSGPTDREVVVSHQSDLLTQDLIFKGTREYCRFSDYGLSFDYPLTRYDHSSGNISYPAWQVRELERLDLSAGNLKKLIRFFKAELAEYEGFLMKFKKRISQSADAPAMIAEYFAKSKKMAGTISYFSAFEMGLQRQLEKEGLSAQDIPSSLTDTSRAAQKLERLSSEHETELTELRLRPGPVSLELAADLKKFCKRFGYLGMMYFKGAPWTVAQAYQMLLGTKAASRFRKKTNRAMSDTVEAISDMLRLRTEKWELMCQGCFLFRKFMKRFFADVIAYEDLLRLTVDEALGVIKGQYPSGDTMQDRRSFVLEIVPDGIRLSKSQNRAIGQAPARRPRELRGMVACAGKAVGPARIILSPKDGYSLNEGDILVTKMSTPDFLPIMKKAAAFVTDIGGITSHAAIVSREMHKPCIIGTKDATAILTDGMMIEVDADNGVVRVL